MKKGKQIYLKNAAGKIFSYKILQLVESGDKGASCLCYIVEKQEDKKGKIVLLKEFYPNIKIPKAKIKRIEDGTLQLENISLNIWNSQKKKFINGMNYLRKFREVKETRDYICVDDNVELLEGYGTVYYENTYINNSISWKTDVFDNNERPDEIIQIAIKVYTFLMKVHKKNLAYVDLKPSDILLKVTKSKNLNTTPLFYDFNSMVPIGQYRIDSGMIDCTPLYQPPWFQNRSGEEMVSVDLKSEQYTFGAVLKEMLTEKMQMVSLEVRLRIEKLLINLMHKETMEEKEIIDELIAIRDKIRDDEYSVEYQKLPKRIKGFRVLQTVNLLITLGAYILVTVILGYLCINKGNVNFRILKRFKITTPHFVFLLLGITIVLLLLLKLAYMKVSSRIANSMVSCRYYQSDIRDGEYSAFYHGKRRKTLFQDTHKGNAQRQRLRHVLWVLLPLGLIIGLKYSLMINSFPVFIVEGSIITVLFIYIDFFLSIKSFYDNYRNTLNISADIELDSKGAFYEQEYDKTDGTFNLEHNFYKKNRRNLFKIRKAVCSTCLKNGELYLEGEEKNLKFSPLEIKHIYKMCFDRIQNIQNILTFVVFILTIVAIAMGITYYMNFALDYFRIERKYYLIITFVFLITPTIMSCIQILYSLKNEMAMATASYKSRYVIENALNDELVKDIATNFIKPVDMARGIYQYTFYMLTREDEKFAIWANGRVQNQKGRPGVGRIPLKNKSLLHHTFITGQSRLALSVWMGFVILFAIIVWQFQIYWMGPILLIFACIIHFSFGKWVVPKLSIWHMKKRIHKNKIKKKIV